MKITGNEPAYPATMEQDEKSGNMIPLFEVDENVYNYPGLSIRQQFAMAAMQGLLSSPRQYTGLDWIVQNSVEIADALIAELNRTEE